MVLLVHFVIYMRARDLRLREKIAGPTDASLLHRFTVLPDVDVARSSLGERIQSCVVRYSFELQISKRVIPSSWRPDYV